MNRRLLADVAGWIGVSLLAALAVVVVVGLVTDRPDPERQACADACQHAAMVPIAWDDAGCTCGTFLLVAPDGGPRP
jgi:hypothetical protein